MNRTGVRPLDDHEDAIVVPAAQGLRAQPAPGDEDSILRRILTLAAEAVGAPIGFISLTAAGRQLARVQTGIAGPLRPADVLLPARLIARAEPIVIPDLHAAEWRSLVPATGLLGARFAVILPFGMPGGGDAGTLCLIDTVPRDAPDERTMHLLTGLAALAGAERSPAPRPIALQTSLPPTQFDTVFREALVGIVHRDLDGRVLMANDLYCTLTGRTPAELAAIPPPIIVHPDDLLRNEGRYRAHLGTGTPFRIELRYIRPNGAVSWCEVNISFLRDEGGTIRSTITVAQDITRRRLAEQALRESREHHRHLVALNPQLQWMAQPDGSIEEIGPLWSSLTGVAPEQALGNGWIALLHPDDVAPTMHRWRKAVRRREPFDAEYRLQCRDAYRWMRARAAPRCGEDGAIIRWYGSLEDIDDRKATQAALAASEERLRLAVQAAHLGVWDVDLTSGERRWSDELLKMVGLPANAEPSIATALEIIHPEDRAKFQSVVSAANGDLFPAEFPAKFEIALRIHRRNDGAMRWLKTTGWKSVTGSGHLNRLIVTVQDVTEEHDAEERISWAATHDPLTLLPNRLAVQQELDRAIALAAAAQDRIGLMLFDVDNLKRINDTLGHDAGDALLRVFARRLIEVAPPGATIGRLGGDEFAILMPVQGTADVEGCAAALIRSLREPFAFNGRTLDCAASIGAAIFPDHGTNPTELLKSADLALYTAKTTGRGRSQLFRSEMRSDLQRQFSMINLAKDALANARVEAFYQPKIDLHTNGLVGFEALLRWHDPHGATHLPADITAAFDDSDLSIELTDRILDKVTGDLRRWLDQGFDPISVAVNTSANDFRYDNFAERVLEHLARRKLPPQRLEIEVTETVFLGRGAPFVERALRMLSAEGIRIALDDFGTGYASLSHLKQYPVDVLKIDRSFISNLEHSPDDAAIADAVIDLGRNLGISVVAEGIETRAQARHLRRRGCAVGQGFLFGHPVRAGAIFPAWRDRRFAG